ncbi:hypothetical protein E2542_SST15913 [Spatholobus suberectus]|nr:hypothetical protein E2542_SST15913 [Spatholobus suberectus]
MDNKSKVTLVTPSRGRSPQRFALHSSQLSVDNIWELAFSTEIRRVSPRRHHHRVRVANLTLSIILVTSSLTLKSQQSTKSLVLFRSTILVAVLTSLLHQITYNRHHLSVVRICLCIPDPIRQLGESLSPHLDFNCFFLPSPPLVFSICHNRALKSKSPITLHTILLTTLTVLYLLSFCSILIHVTTCALFNVSETS